MDEEPDFTMGDLLYELADRFGRPANIEVSTDGLYTTGEIAKLYGVSRSKALGEIKKLFEEGRIEVSSKRIERFSGGEVVVPAYRFIKPKGEDDE